MANRERGEMTLVAGEATYVLRLTTNACCELEERSGKSAEDHIDAWTRQHRLTALRWLLWASLQDHHASEFTSPEAVGPMLDRCNRAELEQVILAFMLLNTEIRDRLIRQGVFKAAAGKGAADPPRAQAAPSGTGSTSTVDASA